MRGGDFARLTQREDQVEIRWGLSKPKSSAAISEVGTGSVRGCGRVEIVSGDDLQAGRRNELLVDEDDGSGCAGWVVELGSSVNGSIGAGGYCSGRKHDKGVSTDKNVEIAGIGTEGDAGDQRGDGGELLASWNEVDVDGADARGLVDKAE